MAQKCCICEELRKEGKIKEDEVQSTFTRVSYTIPTPEKKVKISTPICERHKQDFSDALKWYLVSESLWYPGCISHEWLIEPKGIENANG